MHGRSPHIFIIVLSLIPKQNCRDVVASAKFFPIEGPDGKQNPLCERLLQTTQPSVYKVWNGLERQLFHRL